MRCNGVWQGLARQVRSGVMRAGEVGSGKAGRVCCDEVNVVRSGVLWWGRIGSTWSGRVSYDTFRYGR